MNNIFTRYNFTYQNNYVHERKEKGDLRIQPVVHTLVETRSWLWQD